MSDDPTTESKPTGRASSAIWAGIKYGVLAYALWYAAKWLGWVGSRSTAPLTVKRATLKVWRMSGAIRLSSQVALCDSSPGNAWACRSSS